MTLVCGRLRSCIAIQSPEISAISEPVLLPHIAGVDQKQIGVKHLAPPSATGR